MKDINNPHTVMKFEYNPSKENGIKSSLYEDQNPLSFIPAWYIKELN